MPEQNFEQKARHMADGFSMEPGEAVWQRVEAAIGRKKRRRRLLVWWWLLPLTMAGGSMVLFWNNKEKQETKQLSSQYSINDSILKPEKQKVSVPSPNKLSNEKNSGAPNINIASQKKAQPVAQAQPLTDENNNDNIKTENEFEEKNVNAFTRKNTVIRTEASHDSLLLLSSPLPPFKPSQNQIISLSDSSVSKINTTVNRKKDSSVEIKNPVQNIAKKETKKRKINTWQYGVLAEGGAASWGSGPLQKSLVTADAAIGQLIPGIATNYLNSTGGRIAVTSRGIRSGAYFGIGAAVRKSGSKKIDFVSQLSYRYQLFHITQTIRIDTATSTSPGNSANYMYRTLQEKQQFHFADLNAGIDYQTKLGKRFGLSLEAGLANSLLIAVRSQSTGSNDSLKSNVSANSFHRWQPAINAAAGIEIYTGKTAHWQLSPGMRFGLRPFQKNGLPYKNNHLTSAGLRLIYFFK